MLDPQRPREGPCMRLTPGGPPGPCERAPGGSEIDYPTRGRNGTERDYVTSAYGGTYCAYAYGVGEECLNERERDEERTAFECSCDEGEDPESSPSVRRLWRSEPLRSSSQINCLIMLRIIKNKNKNKNNLLSLYPFS